MAHGARGSGSPLDGTFSGPFTQRQTNNRRPSHGNLCFAPPRYKARPRAAMPKSRSSWGAIRIEGAAAEVEPMSRSARGAARPDGLGGRERLHESVSGRRRMVVYRIVLTDDYIEEAQRLILAQNRTLRLLYQSPWVWWFPRVTLAASLVILLVVRLPYAALMNGAFLVLTFIGEFHSRWVLTKARNRIRAK